MPQLFMGREKSAGGESAEECRSSLPAAARPPPCSALPATAPASAPVPHPPTAASPGATLPGKETAAH